MELPEFRVSLTRLQRGETAYPQNSENDHDEYIGQRSKFGGRPDLIHGDQPPPKCSQCSGEMTFVAQIDSIEHDWPSNPHAVDSLSSDQKWMFSDAGMIYVFFCFDCGQADAHCQYY